MDIGDIVRHRRSFFNRQGQLAIVLEKRACRHVNPDGADEPRFHIGLQWQDAAATLPIGDGGVHIYWLEVVHAVNTPEAQAIHQQYPQYQGRDYNWYLEQRGLLPPAMAELEEQAFATNTAHLPAGFTAVDIQPTIPVGARIRVNITDPTSFARRFHGLEGVILRNPNEENAYLVQLDGDITPNPRYFQHYQIVPVAVPVFPTEQLQAQLNALATPLPVEQWLPGDIVERNEEGGPMRYSGAVYGTVGDRFIIRSRQNTNLYVNGLDNGRVPECWDTSYFTWISRPAALQEADTATEEAPAEAMTQAAQRPFQVGDRVRIVGIIANGGRSNGQEAAISHVSYSTVQLAGNDNLSGSYSFQYLELVTPAPVQPLQDLPADQWQVGDILECTSIQGCDEGVPSIEVGQQVTMLSNADSTASYCLNVRVPSGQESGNLVWSSAFRFVERPGLPVAPAPAPVAAPASWREWQVGDILRRTDATGGGDDIPLHQEVVLARMTDIAMTNPLVYVSTTEGRELTSGLWPMRFTWVSRPGAIILPPMPTPQIQAGSRVRVVNTTAPWLGNIGTAGSFNGHTWELHMDNGDTWRFQPSKLELVADMPTALPPDQWLPGDILRRVAVTSDREHIAIGEEAAVRRIETPSYRTINMELAGSGYGWWVPKADLEFVRRPGTALAAAPTTPAKKPIQFPCLVDVAGTTPEQRAAFEEALLARGLHSYSDGGLGCYEKSTEAHHNKLAVGYESNKWLYYNYTTYPLVGGLLENWNGILQAVENKLKKRVLQQELTFPAPTPARTLGLWQLPAYAVLESRGKKDAAQQAAFFEEHGFPNVAGKYLLLAHSKLTGTNNAGVAKAFQQAHNAVWLHVADDKQTILNLFTKRKLMLSKSASQQRFALDVAASTPPLITAFKAFMAHIGYRQQNAELQDGPYILLNGGNIFPDQPLTWQYSECYNRRNKLLSLSDDKGWEYMVDRVTTAGVARPVEQADELDAVPQAGDSVLLVNVAVQEGLPETENELSYHAAGKVYTISSIHNGKALLKETNLMLSVERLAVVEKPRGISAGDTVITTSPYGELVPEGKLYTYMENDAKSKFGVLVDEEGNSYSIPPTHYRVATEQENKQYLLSLYHLTLPFVAKITNPEISGYGDEVVMNDCWPLSNKRLAFWPEADSEKDSYYERQDFQVVTSTTVKESNIKLLKGSDHTQVQVGEHTYDLKELEEVLAQAYA